MLAAVLKEPRRLVVEEVPAFPLAPDMAMVRVTACGICGSDLRYFAGDNPFALHTRGLNLPNPPNMILGHELVGVVEEVAREALEPLIGQRVAVHPLRVCGRCPSCRRGRENLCRDMIHLGHGAGWGELPYYPGGMAELCPVWQESLLPLPEATADAAAAALDYTGVAVHALHVGDFASGMRVLVLGCGPVGLMACQIARAWGASAVWGSDVYDTALRLLRQAGMEALDARQGAVAERVLEATGGEGVDLVLETVGSQATLTEGLRALGEFGALVNVAVHPGDFSFRMTDLGKQRSLRTSANILSREVQQALDLIINGQVDATLPITHYIPLGQVAHAFEMLQDKEKHGAFKVIVNP